MPALSAHIIQDQTSRPFILMVMRLFRSLLLIPYNTSAIALTSVPAIIRRPSIANRPAFLPAGRTARMPRAQYEGDQAVRRKAMTARQRPHNFVTHRYEFVFVSHSRSPSVSVLGFGTISHFTISLLLPILSEHCFDQLILHEAVTTVRIIKKGIAAPIKPNPGSRRERPANNPDKPPSTKESTKKRAKAKRKLSIYTCSSCPKKKKKTPPAPPPEFPKRRAPFNAVSV